MTCKVIFSITSSLLFCVSVSSVQADYIADRATLDALLGGNQTLEDFESFIIPQDESFVDLKVSSLDEFTVVGRQGPGLVESGAIYNQSSGSGSLNWIDDGTFNIDTKSIVAQGPGAIEMEIVYTTAVTAMGVDLRGIIGFGYFGTAVVYDASDVFVSSTNFEIFNGGVESLFFGWEHSAGIGRVVITDLKNGDFSPFIDNHGYGVVLTGACPWDLDNSGSVGTSDLLVLFAQWGTDGPADFDESGAVGTSDLLILFANWGPCP